MNEVLIVSLLGLATTSSAMAGTAIGLYCPLSKRSLACILAFAAGALISALAIGSIVEYSSVRLLPSLDESGFVSFGPRFWRASTWLTRYISKND